MGSLEFTLPQQLEPQDPPRPVHRRLYASRRDRGSHGAATISGLQQRQQQQQQQQATSCSASSGFDAPSNLKPPAVTSLSAANASRSSRLHSSPRAAAASYGPLQPGSASASAAQVDALLARLSQLEEMVAVQQLNEEKLKECNVTLMNRLTEFQSRTTRNVTQASRS